MLRHGVQVCVAGLLVAAAVAGAHRPHDVIEHVATSEDGQLVLVLCRQLLYRSVDGGYNWGMADKGLPLAIGNERTLPSGGGASLVTPDMQLAVAPGDGATVFLVDHEHGIFKSRDGGSSWEHTRADVAYLPANVRHTPGTVAVAISADYATDQTVFVGRIRSAVGRHHPSPAILRSTDGGQNFAPVWPPREAPANLAVGCTVLLAVGGVIFAGTDTGLVMSSVDRGATWQTLATLPGLVVTGIAPAAVVGQEVATLVVSGYGGANGELGGGMFEVSYLRTASAAQTLSVRRLAGPNATATNPSPSDTWQMASGAPAGQQQSGLLFALPRWSETVLRSRDAGGTWEELDTSTGLTIDANSQKWHSSHWTYVRCPLGAPGVAFAGGFAGLHKTVDGGDTWVKLDILVPTIFELKVAATATPGTLMIAVCTYANDCFGGEVGASMKGHLTGANAGANHRGAPGPARSSKGLLAHWIQPFTEDWIVTMQDYNVAELSPSFGSTKTILRGRKDTILRTADAGKTWETAVRLPVLPHTFSDKPQVSKIAFSPAFSGDKTVFASGLNIGVAVSVDGGETWRTLYDVRDAHVTIAVSPEYATDKTLVATVAKATDLLCAPVFHNTLHISIDDGASWTVLPEVRPQHLDSWESLQFSPNYGSDKTMVALQAVGKCGQGHGVWPNEMSARQIMISRDAGQSWAAVSHDLVLHRQASHDQLLARRTLTVSPTFAATGEIIVALETAGVMTARIDMATMSLTNVTVVDQLENAAHSFRFAQPPKLHSNQIRSLGTKLSYSPRYAQDNTIIGASYNTVSVSYDRGASWFEALRLDNTRLACSQNNCTQCHVVTRRCIKCAPHYTVTREGTCQAPSGSSFPTASPGSTPAVSPPKSALSRYAAAVEDRKGRYSKGAGKYKATVNVATVEGCASSCSLVPSKCFGFSYHPTSKRCDMHTQIGSRGTYVAAGWSFRKVHVKTAVGDGLEVFADPIVGAKGQLRQGAGVYIHYDAGNAKTAEACARTCASAAHAAKCFAFAWKGTGKKCAMYSEIGAAGVFMSTGWSLYRKKRLR